MNTPSPTQTIRTSISLPLQLYKQLDALVEARGFRNRSQALREMIHQQLARFSRENGDDIMAGTITLFYDESKANLSTRLSAIQRKHIAEVISSQHVQLENHHTMEVLVVQGPARKLQAIADELVSCKGVTTGGLNLSNIILPPIHTKSVGDVVPDFTKKDCAVGTTAPTKDSAVGTTAPTKNSAVGTTAPTRTQTTSQEHSS